MTTRAEEYAHKLCGELKETTLITKFFEDALKEAYMQGIWDSAKTNRSVFKDLLHRILIDKISTDEITLFIEDELRK